MLLPTIGEAECALHDFMRDNPDAAPSLLSVLAWIDRRKPLLAQVYQQRHIGGLPFYVLFDDEVNL